MIAVNIHEAKSQLSKMIECTQKGESFIIAKAGKPVAMLVPIPKKKIKIKFGLLKGKIQIAKDFDQPLPDDVLNDFEGNE